jgi:hypothetical protein
MPQIANITVKKNDGTTDVTYTYKSPSAGDGVPAIWRNDAIGTAAQHRPELRLTSRDANSGKDRHMRSTFVWPQIATDSTTSLVSVVNRALGSGDWTMPKGMPAADINEMVAQYANLLASALIKASCQDGFAPA